MVRQRLIDFVKQFEGCRLKTYRDVVGTNTIGFGHTGFDVKPGMAITQDEADKMLLDDLMDFEALVYGVLHIPVNDNQLDALIDFAFNLGIGALQHSTLLKLVNLGQFEAASEEFEKWCHAGGKVSEGLMRRRRAERDLFLEKPSV